jgi:transketolase
MSQRYVPLAELRRLGGLPGHPDVVTHPVVQTSTGSLGMGVSKAKGFVTADRLAGRSGRVYVLTGDGELQEGQFWESLASAANRRMGEITAIVDHNKLQSDTWVDQVSDLGDLQAKAAAWGWAVGRCDGHDLRALDAGLARLDREAPDTPRLLVADTVKGAGVSFMEPRELPHTPRRCTRSIRARPRRSSTRTRSWSSRRAWPGAWRRSTPRRGGWRSTEPVGARGPAAGGPR